MKRIYLILTISILLLGITTASIISISNTDFKTKITTISSSVFYSKLVEENKIDIKDVPLNKEISLENTNIDITQNKEGVYRIKHKWKIKY